MGVWKKQGRLDRRAVKSGMRNVVGRMSRGAGLALLLETAYSTHVSLLHCARYGRYDVDKYGKRFATGYTVLIDNTVFFSEALASNDCVTRLSPVGCFYSLMPLTGGVVPVAAGTEGGGGEGAAGDGPGAPQAPTLVPGTAGGSGRSGGGDGGKGHTRVLVPVLTAVLVGKRRVWAGGLGMPCSGGCRKAARRWRLDLRWLRKAAL